jgi:hypothetical protein
MLSPFAEKSMEGWLTRTVVPRRRSRTKTSNPPFESGDVKRLRLSKATKRPFAEIEGASLRKFPCAPFGKTLTRSVTCRKRSLTKTSAALFVSPGTRFEEVLAKVTNRPPAEIADVKHVPSPSAPAELTLTRSVTPCSRSRTKVSMRPFVSPLTRFVARLWKTTKRPSEEILASELTLSPCVPVELTLTSWVVPNTRSRTKTSRSPFVSPATRFDASLSNATKRPFAEIEMPEASPLSCPR